MNRLVIIGNGFDLAHGLKTSYQDFFGWYWDDLVVKNLMSSTNTIVDLLCKVSINKDCGFNSWCSIFSSNWMLNRPHGKEWYNVLHDENVFSIEESVLLKRISNSIENKGWVDIENEYYSLLKGLLRKNAQTNNPGYTIEELNEQMSYLQLKLVEYLKKNDKAHGNGALFSYIKAPFDPNDFSNEGKGRALVDIYNRKVEEHEKYIPEKIMLLSFNYTSTVHLYDNFNCCVNFIHGDLENPNEIIFGYGDELDEEYKDVLNEMDNHLLNKVKSVRYLETTHYQELLNFLSLGPFQVFIMGHSCGNSDRTLLNTIFEHENCISIKPFYHKWKDETDNYLELVQNISRNFTDRKLFRDRVVNKKQCRIM